MLDEDRVMKANFSSPPVVEAVIGVEFATLPIGFVGLADIHRMWMADYPTTEEHEALEPSTPFDQPAPPVQFRFGTGVPRLRLWSKTEDEQWLIQVQADRLVVNWRRAGTVTSYPGYQQVLGRFEKAWQAFCGYLHESELGSPQPLVVEYTYVNVIAAPPDRLENALSTLSTPGSNMPGVGLFTRYQSGRIVEEEEHRGQVLVTGEPVDVEGASHLNLTISSRVFLRPLATSETLRSAVDFGHHISLNSFLSVTSESAQAEWRGTE